MFGPETVESPSPPGPLASLDTDGLGDALGQLAALGCGVRAQELKLIAELDRREAWRADGQTSMATWLVMAHGVTLGTAREQVRVARAVTDLPATFASFAAGRLSWDQLAAVTRLATPATDAHWAAHGPGITASELARLARAAEERTTRDQRCAHEGRGWVVRPDRVVRDAQVATLRLPAAEMARVVAAVERQADIDFRAAGRDETTDTAEAISPTQRRADALVALAGATLASDADPDRATVVVHASVEALRAHPDADPDGVGAALALLPDGSPLAVATLQRLACDARWQWVYEGPDGRPLGIGRVARTVPAWLRRHLDQRDGGTCRFPGCERRLGLHAHHRRPWEVGGPTDAANLLLVCVHHHHLLHEGGWRLHGDAEGAVTFTRPDGTRTLPSRPPGRHPDTRRRWRADQLPPLPPES